jgi:predicted outer membrane protein
VLTRIVQVVTALAIICTLSAPHASAQSDFGPEYTQTQFGPMGPAGKDMLVKVRLAGLWEGPAGRLGLEKSANPRIKEAGRHLITGHAELDAKVLELGRTLNVPLPSEANSDQQGWIAEMTNAPAGSVEFDRIFANRLRAAHGGVYKFLAVVRTGTRNTAIRDFAKRCMEVVLDHIQVLEASGMVDFNDTKAIPLAALVASPSSAAPAPTVPQAVPNAPRTQTIAQEKESDGSDVILGILVMVAVVGGIYFWTGGRLRRPRSSRQ